VAPHSEVAPARRVVILAASAGGPLALGTVLEGLPPTLDAAVIVVMHLAADHRSLLPQILARRSTLPVKQAEDGDMLVAGQVYVAPSGAHLVVRGDRRLALDKGPAVHFHRPSIDVLLDSAAAAFEGQSLAVVLTGSGSDGAEGVRRIKLAGGTVLAQDDAATQLGMPHAARETGVVDQVLALDEIAAAIALLIERGAS
jgi:two-component system chemotaxis response regulator CheB